MLKLDDDVSIKVLHKSRRYQEEAGKYLKEMMNVNQQLAAESAAHAITLRQSMAQAREIERLTHQLTETRQRLLSVTEREERGSPRFIASDGPEEN